MDSDRWKQVDNLLQAALERPPAGRAEFLRQACAGDESLEREVRSLLASQQEAGSFLESPAIAVAAPKPALNPSLEPSLDPDDATQTIYSLIDRKVSHYRIIEKLGSGGMGVVYKAEDSRLGRFVALKFLSEEFAHDSAWMSRFQREARILASLNHPRIAAIYGLEESDGLRAIAMELVEGPTLAERMARGRIAVVEALAIAGQVVEAMEYAHENGIVHRDLKPANVKLRPDGAIKVLDFGLAKSADAKEMPAATATHTGVVMGTPAYMAPEQAAGLPVDRRADIWAFGVVLFEMLAGCRIYARRTGLETLAAVARDEPPWDKLPEETPGPIVHLLRRCLDKDPQRRLRDIGEARIAIEEAMTAPSVAASPARTKRISKTGGLAAFILMVLLLGGMFLVWFRRPAPDAARQVVQFDVSPPPGTLFAPTISRQSFAISPDGKRLVFSATGANGTNIWIRDLASLELHAVPGTEDAWSMFWAQDSRSIFFSVKRTLKQANLDTGSGRTVAELPDIAQLGTWRANGDLLLYLGPGENYELHLEDGALRKGPVFEGMRWPQFLPGGERLVYAVYDKALQHNRAVAVDYLSPKPVFLTQTDSRVQYAPPRHPGEPGYLLFIRGSSLLAQPFDADRLSLAGEPFPIAQDVIYYGPNLSSNFSVSENGVLVYQAGFPNTHLNWYDRAGNEMGEVGRPAQHWGNVRISRDGRRVAASVWSSENGAPGIWIFDANGRESRRLTFPPEIHRRPVWSPDGTRLALGRSVFGGPQLATLDLAANGTPQEFVNQSSSEHVNAVPTDWSADGRFIAFDDGVGAEQRVAWIADVSSRKFMPFLKNEFAQWGTAFSPDGKRVAFASLESGRPEVYVQAFESAPSPHVVGERRQVSREGAWLVRWRGDGRELFYLGLDNLLQAVPVQGPLEFGEPKPLFRIAGASQYGTTRDFQFDVSPDGQRFIMPTTGSVPPPPFTVIENWQDKFRRR